MTRRRGYVLIACMLATFMAAIEATIVATAMPTVVARLGGFALIGWVFAVYLLTQAVSIPIYGRLADLYGRKRVFFAGAFLFLVGSTLCGFASSMIALVLFRALQGLGAGCILPISNTIVGDVYTAEERAGAQAYLGSVWGIAAVAGPLLGAFIVRYLPWAFVFWLNLPVGAAAVAILATCFHEPRYARPHRLDIAGALLLACSVVSLLLALLQADRLGLWGFALGGLAVVLLAILVRHERRVVEPLFPLALWRERAIVAGAGGNLAIGASLMATSAFLPTYVQAVMGGGPLGAGAMLALMSLSWPIAAVLAGRMMRVHSYRATATAGGAVLLAGSLMLALLGLLVRAGLGYAGELLWSGGGAALIGAGMGLCNTTFLVSVQNTADHSLRGIATASTNFMRMLGAALGTALLGAVLNLRLANVLPGVADPVQALVDPVRRSALGASDLDRLADGVAAALHGVFWAACVFALAAIAIARQVPSATTAQSRATP
jgi:EmrB/QacA subfamily drug resistance transporter